MIDWEYWHWKLDAIKLLQERTTRVALDAEEQRIMVRAYKLGQTPDFFVKLLEARDSLSRDTVENMK